MAEKIIEGLKEAVAFASGDPEAIARTRVTVKSVPQESESRRQAKALAFKIMPPTSKVLDLNYAIDLITPLFDRIAELEAEADSLAEQLQS